MQVSGLEVLPGAGLTDSGLCNHRYFLYAIIVEKLNTFIYTSMNYYNFL